MKKLFFILFLFSITEFVTAQERVKDSLLTLLSNTKEDTTRINLLYDLSNYYSNKSLPDSAIFWGTQGLALAQKIGYKKDENEHKLFISYKSWEIGDFATAIKMSYAVFEYAKSINDTSLMMNAIPALSNAYRDQGDYREALNIVWKFFDLKMDSSRYAIVYAVIGSNFYGLEKYDSAYLYLKKAITFPKPFNSENGWIPLIAGRTLEKLNNDSMTLYYYRQSIRELQENFKDLAGAYNSLASFYAKKSQSDSTIYYANKALIISQQHKFNKEKAETYLILSKIYEKVNPGKAFGYYKLAISTRDSLYNQEKQRQISSFKFNEELRKNEIQNAKIQSRNRLRMNTFLGSTFTLILIAIFLFINNRRKQKAKQKIESAFDQLKSTQSQLIQSEKMASLGELTAGIAHEIQNPLNFVNNFSDVSTELLDEMKEELLKGNKEGAIALADDVILNLEKINHHGKRADAIVKGMLQHSRSSSGVKEPTDINALCEEYSRLAYHGLKAKDNSFNATLETDFEEGIGKISIVPQDIGRVILNLLTNAFYAVTEKKKSNIVGYEPAVSVSTRKISQKVEIRVRDNGNGIPEKVLDKIFQPFFTTKPAGEGTGLGLSLSYEIITKGHDGALKVDTKEGEFTEFILILNC